MLLLPRRLNDARYLYFQVHQCKGLREAKLNITRLLTVPKKQTNKQTKERFRECNFLNGKTIIHLTKT